MTTVLAGLLKALLETTKKSESSERKKDGGCIFYHNTMRTLNIL